MIISLRLGCAPSLKAGIRERSFLSTLFITYYARISVGKTVSSVPSQAPRKRWTLRAFSLHTYVPFYIEINILAYWDIYNYRLYTHTHTPNTCIFFFLVLLINPFLSDVRLTSWACASSIFLLSFLSMTNRALRDLGYTFQLPLVNIKKSLAPIFFLWRLSFSIFISILSRGSFISSFLYPLFQSLPTAVVDDSYSAHFSYISLDPFAVSLFLVQRAGRDRKRINPT